MAAPLAGLDGSVVHGYQRRRPEQTLLYQIVAQHYPAFAAKSTSSSLRQTTINRETGVIPG
jgi:hypothetical protein